MQWLKENYRLPEEAGDHAGKYELDYVPYFWGIFYALDNPVYRFVIMMKAAQIGWTFALIGWLGRCIDTDPSAIIILFPKDGAAREFNDEKFTPAIKSTPALAKQIDTTGSRKSGNRALFKKFAAGFLKMVGSNSVGNVKSTPARRVIVEEPDDTNENIKEQGDSIQLAKERLKRQREGKMVLGGTPGVKFVSRVEEHINLSNQMVLPIKCHDCGDKHVLDWENVSWITRDEGKVHPVYGRAEPDTAVYCCPHCGSIWDDWRRKQNVLDTCREARDAGDPFCGWVPTAEGPEDTIGFKELNELYVRIPGTPLARVVRDYLKAEHDANQGDVTGKIVFMNSKLARPYEYDSNHPEIDTLEDRAEDYKEFTLPEGALALVGFVDVQWDRLAIQLWGVGRGEEMWLVYWGEISANKKTTDETDPVWVELDKILFTPRKHAKGFLVPLLGAGIDAGDGNTSDTVYGYVRKRKNKGLVATKGWSLDYGEKEIYSKPRPIDHKNKNKAAKYGVHIYMVGTHKAKDLLIGDQGRITFEGCGPGRVHWYKGVRADFYDQLLSEIKVPNKRTRGKLAWEPRTGVRNEGLDCAVGSLHTSRRLKLHIKTDQQWDDLERRLSQSDMFSGGASVPNSNDTSAADLMRDMASKLNG